MAAGLHAYGGLAAERRVRIAGSIPVCFFSRDAWLRRDLIFFWAGLGLVLAALLCLGHVPRPHRRFDSGFFFETRGFAAN